jgi:excisionase family DNA binding protein
MLARDKECLAMMTFDELRPGALYTLKEVCELLRISDATARRWIKQGRLRARRVGREYKVLGREVVESIEAARWKVFGPESTLLQLSGAGNSGRTDVADHHHRYLAEAYHDHSQA